MITREEVISIPVTPKLLRSIADDIERRMNEATIGDPVPGHAFYGPRGEASSYKVQLVADQDAWHAQKAGGPWK